MTYTFDEYEERCRFDTFCKVVLRHEAIDYFRELSRQQKREIQFNTLLQYEMDKLCTVDEYPSNSVIFSAYGYTLHIQNELVANAYASLPEQEQKILILRYVPELAEARLAALWECSAALYNNTEQIH